MGFLARSDLDKMGFRSLGRNVLISDRAVIHDPHRVSIDDNSRIDDFCVLSGSVIIGKNVHIAVFCNLAGGSEGIAMADFSGLAYGCVIFTQSDDYTGRSMTNPTVPAQFKKEIKKPISIGRHAILGTNTLVFPGVTIAEGTASGAMAVIHRDTAEWSIYIGNPAKRVKDRKRDLLSLESEYLSANANR